MQNPWMIPYACPRCKDRRWLARDASAREIVPCPDCFVSQEVIDGKKSKDPDVRERSEDAIRISNEAHKYKKRQLSGIEDQDYHPEKDPEFLKEVEVEMAKHRIATEIPVGGPVPSGLRADRGSEHPCVRCGAECEPEKLFCTDSCLTAYKAEKSKKLGIPIKEKP